VARLYRDFGSVPNQSLEPGRDTAAARKTPS
jgi:hypothetical protein